ncbi:hypothetical protein BDQ12DRAFT_448731 [Crucibulum laeve]|uniref:RBR-type E3 ubiquitin transferase n=1 Tax=Crucibulum laeve TaxID=68775 RepID=A0A5C3LJ12_9AGAR|nr:hypothetical protein BDQ12DRAFT_448731 [Crucibulum laeve]
MSLVTQLGLANIDVFNDSLEEVTLNSARMTDEEFALELQEEAFQVALMAADDTRLVTLLANGVEYEGALFHKPVMHDPVKLVAEPSNYVNFRDLNESENDSEEFFGPDIYNDKDVGFECFDRFDSGLSDTLLLTNDNIYEPIMPRIQCTVCTDLFEEIDCVKAPCTHDFCIACVITMVDNSLQDDEQFPPKCCQQNIPLDLMNPFLDAQTRSLFGTKSLELTIPAAHRVYCAANTCSTFLGSAQDNIDDMICYRCEAFTCSSCKQPAHVGEKCGEDGGTRSVREFAKQEGWQTCPNCNAVVEKTYGCHHMGCRCGTQFCYVCGGPWGKCSCT